MTDNNPADDNEETDQRTQMTDAHAQTVQYDEDNTDDSDAFDQGEFADELPARPRQRWLTPWSAVLFAILIGAVGFFVGIKVEKAHNSGSGATASGFPAGASRFASALRSGKSGFPERSGGAGFAGAFGNATTGTVSSIDGDTLYVSETGGNTVKVKLSSATKVTKSLTVHRSAVRPGDEVTIQGQAGSDGAIAATSVSDSGAGSSAGNSSSTSSSSSSNSTTGSSAVSSLFGN